MSLNESLDLVSDSTTFLNFVKQLILDREDEVRKEKLNPQPPYSRGANGWENGSIETFLEAAIAWAEDSDFGERQGLSSDNPWRLFAVFLYCGKIYE